MSTEDKSVNTPLNLSTLGSNDIQEDPELDPFKSESPSSPENSIMASKKSDAELIKELTSHSENTTDINPNELKIFNQAISSSKKIKIPKIKDSRKLFKKFDPYSKKVDLVPPTLATIPKLMGPYNEHAEKRKKKKDFIDQLPNPVPPQKFKIIKGKKVIKKVKYRPKLTYYKHWKKEEKAYPFTDGYSFIDQGLSVMTPELYQRPIKKIYTMKTAMAANPAFTADIHSDIEDDYFQLVFPKFDPSLDRLKQIQTYIEKWMAIDKTSEKIDIKYYTVNNKTIYNRVIVDYFNMTYYKKKKYIIDVIFSIEKIHLNEIVKLSKFVPFKIPKNKYFEKNYLYTKKYKCNYIRKLLHKPKIFTCDEEINDQNYVLNNVFMVSFQDVYTLEMKTDLLFSLTKYQRVKAVPLYPERIWTKTEPIPDPKELIKKRIQALKTPYSKLYDEITPTLEEKRFKDSFDSLTRDINKYKLYYHTHKSLGEHQYQQDMKKGLWDLQKQMYLNMERIYRNYETIEFKNENVNTFNINQEVLKNRSVLLSDQDIHAFKVKRKRFLLEEHIRKIMNYLDFIYYLKQRKFENQYYKPSMTR